MLDAETDKPLIILEFANNHMGKKKLYEAMVDEFSDIQSEYRDFRFSIKLQYRDLDSFIHPKFKGSDHTGVKRFESTKVSIDEWSSRIDYAISKGFSVGCTPFDEVSVTEVLKDSRFSFLKIGSCSFNDWPFLEKIREELDNKNKTTHIIASTGGMSLEIIDKVVSFLKKSTNLNLTLMHCMANYPCSISNQNLSWIRTLSQRYQTAIGFSTHEDGDEEYSGAYAYCNGATIFEKHVVSSIATTVNAYSSNPNQIRRWLNQIMNAEKYIGSEEKRVKEFTNEKKYLDSFRRGVYIGKDMPKGHISHDDVYMAFPRQEGQLTANEWSGFMRYDLDTSLESHEPVTSNLITIQDTRTKIDEIRLFVKDMLRKTNIVVEKGARLEISHHYGLERYDEVGMSMLTLVNLEYCKKIMILKANQMHPEQYHKTKRETFIILHGEVDLILDGVSTNLQPGHVVTINPGVVHAFTAVVDSVIEEISSTHQADDSYYIDEAISNNTKRKSYISLFE
jgi:sialic acid synthase SpsE/mannose-6-phosphate isomerase-like protein (cupin superfamily)